MKEITMYTDGACSGNPGPGGYAAIVIDGGSTREVCGAKPRTTNQRMELTAAREGLVSLDEPSKVEVVTDSSYLANGMGGWVRSWEKNNWLTSAGKPVKNLRLWKRLIEAAERHDVTWTLVKGHSGVPGNEAADALAKRALQEWREEEYDDE